MRIVFYEDYQSNPARMMADTLAFLGVDEGFQPDMSKRYLAANGARRQMEEKDRSFLTGYYRDDILETGAHVGSRSIALAALARHGLRLCPVADKKINAFSLPAGPILVNTGSVEAADNEAQLAGVIAPQAPFGHSLWDRLHNSASGRKVRPAEVLAHRRRTSRLQRRGITAQATRGPVVPDFPMIANVQKRVLTV